MMCKERIISYCESDIKYLPQMLLTMKDKLIPNYINYEENNNYKKNNSPSTSS